MGSNQQNVGQASNAEMQAFISNLPQILQAYNNSVGPTAQAQLGADTATAPGYAKLNADLYKQYAPGMAATGDEINRATALAGAQTEADVAAGPGQSLVDAALKYQQQTDPEFYDTRKLVSKGYADLIGGQNPNALTPAELENTQRGAARMPGYFTPSANKTLGNALLDTNALTAKRDAFGRALSVATAGLPSLKSGYNAFEVATRRPLTSNSGTQAWQPAQTGTGQNAFGVGNQWLNQVGGAQQAAMQKQKSLLDNVSGWGEFGSKIAGGAAAGVASFI